MKMHFKSYSLAAALGLLPASVFGLGIRLPDQDAFATARGEAFVATADNPSAIYYNPAGITQLDGQNLRLGVYVIDLWDDYSGTGANSGVHKSTKYDLQAVPQLYYAFTPKQFPISFGLGVYSPYGLSLKWPDSSPFRTVRLDGNWKFLI